MIYKYFLLEMSKIILIIFNIHYFLNFNDFILFLLIYHIINLFYLDNNNNIKFNKEKLFNKKFLFILLINFTIVNILTEHKLFKKILKENNLNKYSIFSEFFGDINFDEN